MSKRIFKSIDEARAAVERGELGTKAVHMTVLHDDWCTQPSTGECNCSPDYQVEALTAEAYSRGAAAQADWLKKNEN